jgi:hypothetical protein
MPDQYGRPTFEDGASLAQGLSAIQGMQQRKTEFNQEQKSLQLASELVKDPAIKIDPAKYTPQEALLARAKAAQLSIDESQAAVSGKQALAAKYEKQFLESMPKMQSLIAKRGAGDVQGYKKDATEYYNAMVGDGHYATLTSDGNWEVQGPDGTKQAIPFPSDEAVDEFIAFNSQPQSFIATAYANDRERHTRNVANLAKGEELVVDGKNTGVFFTMLEKGNRAEPFFYDPFTNAAVEPKTVKSLMDKGAVTREQYDQHLSTYKKMNEATSSAQDVVTGKQRIGLNQQEAGLKGLEATNKVLEAESKRWDIHNKSKEGATVKADAMTKLNDRAWNLTHSEAGTGDNKKTIARIPDANEMLEINGLAKQAGLGKAALRTNDDKTRAEIVYYDKAGKEIKMGKTSAVESGLAGAGGNSQSAKTKSVAAKVPAADRTEITKLLKSKNKAVTEEAIQAVYDRAHGA